MIRKECVLLALVAALLSGCLKDDVGGVRIASESSAELYSVPRQVAAFFFHAGGPWTAECTADWLHIVKDSGQGGNDTLIVYTTEKNLTGGVRSTQVTLTSGGKTETVDITQTDEFALFAQKELGLPAEGGLVDVAFTTNIRDSLLLYYSANMADWLIDTRKEDSTTKGNTRAVVEGNLKFLRVQPNTLKEERSGYFLLSMNGKNSNRIDLDTLVLRQAPALADSVPANP